MTISMYQASVPRLINGLINLSHLLEKAQTHAEAKKIDPVVFASMRLYPDMFPLSRQVQIACDVCKGLIARLAGVEIPAHEDTEKDLQLRIAKTIAFLETFKPEQIDGTEDKDIVVKRGEKETHYQGMQYLLGHGLPNLYFHTTTTYSMLRAGGVEIGKSDYLGKI